MACLCPMSEKCLSKAVHSRGFSRKLVMNWRMMVSSGRVPSLQCLLTGPAEAGQGFSVGVFLAWSQWWSLLCSVACYWCRREEKKGKIEVEQRWGGLEVEEEGGGGSLEQRMVWVCSGEDGMWLCNWGLYHNANIQGRYEDLRHFPALQCLAVQS